MRGALLVPGGDAAVLLHAVDQPFHPVPLAVRHAVERRVPPVIRPLVTPTRDDGADVPPDEQAAHGRVAVPPIPDEASRPGAWASLRAATDAPGVEERLNIAGLVTLAAREHDGEWLSAAFGAQMHLGGEPAPAAPECLVLLAADGSSRVLMGANDGAIDVVRLPVKLPSEICIAL